MFVVVVWGVNFVVVKVGVNEIPSTALVALRYSLAGLLLLPFIKWPGWNIAKWCVLQGIFLGVLHHGMFFYTLTLMPAGLFAIIINFNVVLVTLMGIYIFKEKVGIRTWLGILIGILGIIILIGFPSEGTSLQGFIAALLATFFVSFTYVIMKKIGNIHAPTYMALLSLPISPILIGISLFVDGTAWIEQSQNINMPLLGSVMFYQVVLISLTHMIWQNLMVKEPMSKIVPLTLLIPIFAIVAGFILLGETLTLYSVVGGLLTILGVAIIMFRQIKKKKVADNLKPL
jgi:O-acetylserine/cysteine efflux transporter